VTQLASAISTTDYHTAGEPFRIVTAGVPPIEGVSVREFLNNVDGAPLPIAGGPA